ncbi:MAG: hypothetical protein AB7T19_13760 [Planctomycetota bacterium]
MHRSLDLDRPFPLDVLPASVVHRDSGSGLRWAMSGALIVGSSAFALTTVGSSFDWTIGVLAAAFVFGAALFGRGLAALVRQDRLSIDRHAIVRHRRTLAGSSVHAEPLANYRGVLLRETLTRLGRKAEDATVVYQVSLVHPDDALTTLLLTTRDRERAQRYHDRVIELLSVPALTAGLSGFSVLSNGVVEDAREDVATANTRLDRIPSELVLEPQARGLGVTIDRCEMGWYSLPIIAGFPAALHWVCTRTPMPELMAWIVFLFTALVAFALFSVFALDRIGRRRLDFQDGYVDYYLRTPFGDLMRQRIELEDLHTATVRRDSGGRPELSIEGRERHVEIGGGLSLEALEWLRALLLGRGRSDAVFGTTTRAAG